MVGDNGENVNNEEIKETIQTIRLGVLHSTKYKRSQKRVDYAISYHDLSTQYGLIENFIYDHQNHHVAVEVSKLIEAKNLPFPGVPFMKKSRLRYNDCYRDY